MKKTKSILNYTTAIDPHKTVSEIQQILAAHGATAILIEYNEMLGGDQTTHPSALKFIIIIDNGIQVQYQLPANWNGVFKVLEKSNIERKYKTSGQAKRTSWRILKDWVSAQMAIIESGQATMAEVFLPYAILQNGDTLYRNFSNNAEKYLTN